MSAALAARRDFILANTRLLAPPLVPELSLWLDEVAPIWKKTEEELGEMGVPVLGLRLGRRTSARPRRARQSGPRARNEGA